MNLEIGDGVRCVSQAERYRLIKQLREHGVPIGNITWRDRHGSYDDFPVLRMGRSGKITGAKYIRMSDGHRELSMGEFMSKCGIKGGPQGRSEIKHHFLY